MARLEQLKVRRWYPIYDRVTYVTAGQTELQFFVNQIGAGTPAKTKADTNMKTSEVLPQGKSHATHALRLILPTDITIDDAQKILKDCILTLNINDEEIMVVPAILFAAGCGIDAMSNITPAATEKQVNNGGPLAKQIQSLGKEPLEWDNKGTLKVNLEWPALQPISADKKIEILLDGYLTKGLAQT